MTYFITFLEGIITFISPCLLPMLPIYISYFAGNNSKHTLRNAIGFVLGFTMVFVGMGAMAGVVGSFLRQYQFWVDIVSGAVVIIFGLSFLDIIKFKLFFNIGSSFKTENLGFFASVLFGIIFSVGWTPCVGAFLGSALALASQQGSVLKGVFMLLLYSLGLGIPFVISAVLIDKFKTTFDVIRKNYRIINIFSGIFLIVVGIAMMTGYMGKLLAFLSFG